MSASKIDFSRLTSRKLEDGAVPFTMLAISISAESLSKPVLFQPEWLEVKFNALNAEDACNAVANAYLSEDGDCRWFPTKLLEIDIDRTDELSKVFYDRGIIKVTPVNQNEE